MNENKYNKLKKEFDEFCQEYFKEHGVEYPLKELPTNEKEAIWHMEETFEAKKFMEDFDVLCIEYNKRFGTSYPLMMQSLELAAEHMREALDKNIVATELFSDFFKVPENCFI